MGQQTMQYKISVITPSYNAVKTIENSVFSVLSQNYKNFEHIIVDGVSTDGTIDILKKYSHLKWISEPDSGQSEAMNKGFERATGDIIVYLNADDYFLASAFEKVIPAFEKGANFVVGDIVVEKAGEYFINVPKVKLADMLRHWEMNAFPYNPVGYFYRKKVQEDFPFNLDNHSMMDLEFLLDVATSYELVKIDALLGVYQCVENTKTVENQKNVEYWTVENFSLIDKYLAKMPDEYIKQYIKDREEGYFMQRRWQLQNM